MFDGDLDALFGKQTSVLRHVNAGRQRTSEQYDLHFLQPGGES